MLTMLESHIKQIDENIKIMERSIFSARYCFIEAHACLNSIDPIKSEILKQWFRFIISQVEIKVDLIIYLRTTPDVLLKRIKERNRHEEKNMEISYLKLLHQLHDDWLLDNKFPFPAPIIVLNGNQNPLEIMKELEFKLSTKLL